MITQLGELTRAEAAPLQRRSERVSLGELARAVGAGSQGLLRERGVTAVVAGEGRTTADRGQLARALRNVVINAIQHSARDGEVRVEVAERMLRVIDRGPGIPADDLPYVFERFYRADPARSTGVAGSGIGLTVARELIGANGGTLEVESTGPEGTTFVIRLPARPALRESELPASGTNGQVQAELPGWPADNCPQAGIPGRQRPRMAPPRPLVPLASNSRRSAGEQLPSFRWRATPGGRAGRARRGTPSGA